MRCVHCGMAVHPDHAGVWREVTGWVQQRANGGAHAIHDQAPTGRYACSSCMALLRRGIAIEQGQLF